MSVLSKGELKRFGVPSLSHKEVGILTVVSKYFLLKRIVGDVMTKGFRTKLCSPCVY